MGARSDGLPQLCPYLAAADRNWRSAIPDREHRCLAVSPPVQLAAEKQRRLCLVGEHVHCATFEAAQATRSDQGRRAGGGGRPIARMTPVILDRGRVDVRLPSLRADRASGQAILVGVLGLAFVAILLARPGGEALPGRAPGTGSSLAPGSAVPTSGAAAPPSAAPATDLPNLTAAPSSGLPAPSPGATAQPATSGATYRVKSGDTLSAIAARFGTTTRVLVGLNGITDPSRIRVGQVLKLP